MRRDPAISIAPGLYDTEVRTFQGELYRGAVDLKVPGIYRNKIAIISTNVVKH